MTERSRFSVPNQESAAGVLVSADFLADRLRLFFGLGAVLALVAGLGFVVFGNSDGRGFLDRLVETDPSLSPWSTFLLMGGAWIACRYARLGLTVLHGLDAGISIAVVAGVAANAVLERGVSNGLLVVFFAVFTQMFRAVVVPSTGPRTVAIASAVALIAFLAVGREHTAWMDDPTRREPALPLVSYGTWLFCAIAIAWTASRVIYGLRREVDEAKRLGQYTIIERIGRGAMGEVFRARHARLRRPTAIKILNRADGDEESLARFEREVQFTSLLSHPNTVQIYDFGRNEDGVFYYAMEYLEGATLFDIVERTGPMPLARALHTVSGIVASLEEAHEEGLVHRDVKPSNVFLCRQGGRHDVVKVVDFGLVMDIRSSETDGKSAELILGTPEYLAPEAILDPGSIDHRVDLYSVGATLQFLLTGRPPILADTLGAILQAQIEADPEPLPEDLPLEIRDLVSRLLAKDREQRPRDAGALQAKLKALAESRPWTEDEAKPWWEEKAESFPLIASDHRQSGATLELAPSTLRLDPVDLRSQSRGRDSN